ncbi:hypothetical protein ACFSVJ_03850 [Prauserella oleivorans]
MNPFPIEEDPVSVPPVSAYQRAIAAFESIARADRPQSWLTVRSREDVLVDAKAVDERVRAGERLPLAGTLVAIQEHPVAAQRLVQSGAVILGIADAAGLAASPVLDVVDAATCWSLPRSAAASWRCGRPAGWCRDRARSPSWRATSTSASTPPPP